MAYYNKETGTIEDLPPRPAYGCPGWEAIDCGCCSGIPWGSMTGESCNRCGGLGRIFRHKESGVVAEYPGGKFLGREPRKSNTKTERDT